MCGRGGLLKKSFKTITIVLDPKLFVSYMVPAFQKVSDPYHDFCGSGIIFLYQNPAFQ
jgi:hypothetical protein